MDSLIAEVAQISKAKVDQITKDIRSAEEVKIKKVEDMRLDRELLEREGKNQRPSGKHDADQIEEDDGAEEDRNENIEEIRVS